MKKILLIVMAGAMLLLTACDGGAPDIQNNPLIEPLFEYEIDTWGSNSEVYEFIPRGDPTKLCVFVMLDNASAMGLQCFTRSSK